MLLNLLAEKMLQDILGMLLFKIQAEATLLGEKLLCILCRENDDERRKRNR